MTEICVGKLFSALFFLWEEQGRRNRNDFLSVVILKSLTARSHSAAPRGGCEGDLLASLTLQKKERRGGSGLGTPTPRVSQWKNFGSGPVEFEVLNPVVESFAPVLWASFCRSARGPNLYFSYSFLNSGRSPCSRRAWSQDYGHNQGSSSLLTQSRRHLDPWLLPSELRSSLQPDGCWEHHHPALECMTALWYLIRNLRKRLEKSPGESSAQGSCKRGSGGQIKVEKSGATFLNSKNSQNL